MKRSLTLTALLILGFALRAGAREGDDYRDLMRRLPDSTNALVVADSAAIRQALSAGNETARAALGINSVPVMAGKFVLGAHIDLTQHNHLWSVAVFKVEGPMTIDDVAKSENATVQKVADHGVVLSTRNAYFVDLGSGVMAAATPANRQLLSRWLRFQDTNRIDVLPPYLLKVASSTRPALITVALDLADSLDPEAIRKGMERSEVLAPRTKDERDAAARIIPRVQGLALTVEPGDPLSGEIMVDFDTAPRPIGAFAKEMLLEVLKRTGHYVSDFDDWKLEIKERSIGIRGPLSANALRKLAMLIRTPVPSPEAATPSADRPADPATRAFAASQNYFKSVTRLLEDLKHDKAKNEESRAGWYDRAADQIGNLPTLDVAPELVGYGSATADQLRTMATAEKNAATQVNYVRRNSYQTAYGWVYGNAQYGNLVPTQKVLDAVKGQAAAARRDTWDRIDQVTQQLRQQMTQKFNAQF